MIKFIIYLITVLLSSVSESLGGEIFSFGFETMFSKRQLPPNTIGKWLFLGCDSIIPVNVSLKNSDEEEYPYKIKIDRKLPKPDSVCDRGENIIIRNIKGVVPGKFTIAMKDSIDDSTSRYYTKTDTTRIIKSLDNEGVVLSFNSGSKKQIVKNEISESVSVFFAGDINKDSKVDFIICWMNNYANQYDVFISRMDKGTWKLIKEAEIKFTD